MILPPEYNWLESYLNNDSLWLEETLNWEETFDLILNDFTLYSFLTTPFFYNNFFFIDYLTKISFLDIILLIETDKSKYTREFYDLFIWDLTSFIHNKFFHLSRHFFPFEHWRKSNPIRRQILNQTVQAQVQIIPLECALNQSRY